jgi:hypothetical protein
MSSYSLFSTNFCGVERERESESEGIFLFDRLSICRVEQDGKTTRAVMKVKWNKEGEIHEANGNKEVKEREKDGIALMMMEMV